MMRSLLRDRNTALWMFRYLHFLKKYLLSFLSPRACFALIRLAGTLGRIRTPRLRAVRIDWYALLSDVGLQTTRTCVPLWRCAADVRLRGFGTLPPAAG